MLISQELEYNSHHFLFIIIHKLLKSSPDFLALWRMYLFTVNMMRRPSIQIIQSPPKQMSIYFIFSLLLYINTIPQFISILINMTVK